MWGPQLLALRAPWLSLKLEVDGCPSLEDHAGAPCLPGSPAPLRLSVPSFAPDGEDDLPLDGVSAGLGGFRNFDLMDTPHLSAGPELSWLTPDSPREDLLRLRVVAPGWGVRYTWSEERVAVGVAACTRFVMFGEDWPVVDVLTSEARIEFRLP